MRYCAWPIIAISVLAAGASVYYTLAYLKIDTNRNALVSSSKHLFKLSEEMNRAFGGRDGLVVVAENGHPSRTIQFAESLAAELRRYPDRFPELFYHVDPEVFKPWALLYLEQKDLLKIKSNLVDQRRLLAALSADPRLVTFYQGINEQIAGAMIGHLFTGFLEEKKEEALPDVTLLNATLKQMLLSLEGQPYSSPFNAFFPKELNDLSQQGYFFTENDKYLLFLVTPQPDGYTSRNQDVALLREVVERVKAQYPGIQAGVTGPDALESDEMGSSLSDISLATWLSLLGQIGLLILFFRSIRRPLVQTLALVIGLCWTFGLVTLVVGHLNLLSMIFAPLMLGLTIDYGIHWFCRLEEEEAGREPCTYGIMACAYQRSAPGITYAGLAAALSFLPLVFMGFKGLAELGLILTMGILVMLLATLVLVPALVRVTERCLPSDEEADECPPAPQPFLHLHWTHPWFIVLLGVVIVAVGVVATFFVPFDLNPLHLQNQQVESVVWEYKLIQDSKYSTSYGAVATSSLRELETRCEALKKLPTVSHVESILSFLPTEVSGKRPILQELQPVLNAIKFSKAPASPSGPVEMAAILRRINFKMGEAARSLEEEKAATKEQIGETHSLINRLIPLLDSQSQPRIASRLAEFEAKFFADLQDKWNLLKGYTDLALSKPEPAIANLPQAVRQRFISDQGTFLIRVFPSQDIWNFDPLKLFVKSLRSVDPNAVGDPVLPYVFTLGFRNACLKAAGLALLAIAVMLLVLFRSWKMILLAFLPLIVGTGLTLNLMWLLGISFNQANVLFVPLILGEGIEFGIIILVRWQVEESARAITLPASTAKGVALAALTTTLGFGSLMVSGHQGVFSLGLLATVGSLSVLLASLSFLPAFIRVVERDFEPREPSFLPYLRLGRWLNHMVRRKTDDKTALDH
jgi:hypothetical protein